MILGNVASPAPEAPESAERHAADSPRNKPRLNVLLVVAVVLAALVAAKFAVPDTRDAPPAERDQIPDTDRGAIAELLDGYVTARLTGRSAEACAYLTEDAQREVARLVGGLSFTPASTVLCPRYVLASSTATAYTVPGVEQLANTELDFKRSRRGGYTLWPLGRSAPTLAARRVNGQWKLDAPRP